MSEMRKTVFLLVVVAIAIAAVVPASADITKTYYANEYGRWITTIIAAGDYEKVASRTGVGNQLWAARPGGLDLIYHDGSNWQVHTVNNNAYTEIVHDGALIHQMLAARPGSLDLIWDQNGTWQTTQLSTNTYTKLTAAGTQESMFWGLRDNGDLDIIWYDKWTTLQWYIDTHANSNYTDICGDGVLTDNRVYAAKQGGRLDVVWYNGSWHQSPLGNDVNGYIEGVYDVLEVDGTVGGGIWAAGPNGLDWIWYNPYAGGVWQAYPQSSARYHALANDRYGIPPNIVYRRVYAARTDGGIDQIMYTGSWRVDPINMTIDGYDGRVWSSLTTDALDGSCFYGALGQPGQYVFDSPNRPDFIVEDGGINVDGNLDDWSNAEWVPLDWLYADPDSWADPTDIEEAYYAAKWDSVSNKVYVAVKVLDNFHGFTYVYTDWDARDGVEIYLKAGGSVGDYETYQQPAQQYSIGFRPDNATLWAAMGYDNLVPESAGFQYAGTIQGDWLIYEVAMTPFKYFGGLSSEASVVSELKAGDVIGVDVVAAGHNGTNFTGMMSENDMASKSTNMGSIAQHQLVSPLRRNAVDGDLVVNTDWVVTGASDGVFYMEEPNRVAGVRVEKPGHQVTVGNTVSVVGFMASDPETGERVIDATYGSATDTGVHIDIQPLGMSNRALGGADYDYVAGPPASGQIGVDGGVGLNNIGLLVKTTGRVSSASGDRFFIDDGSGVVVRVLSSGDIPQDGQYVVVTGISSCWKNGTAIDREILATDWQVVGNVE